MNNVLDILTFAAALGSCLVAGIFFAFSTFIMRALAQIAKDHGISAMQAINVTVLNPWFFGVFFGTAVVCLPVAYYAWTSTDGSQRTCLLAACALYLIGCILVTVAGNVPLNDRLAAIETGTPEAYELWKHYLSRWTLWNHVRTAASFLASGLFVTALRG